MAVKDVGNKTYTGTAADFTNYSNQIIHRGPGSRFVVTNPAAPGDVREYVAAVNPATGLTAWLPQATTP